MTLLAIILWFKIIRLAELTLDQAVIMKKTVHCYDKIQKSKPHFSY